MVGKLGFAIREMNTKAIAGILVTLIVANMFTLLPIIMKVGAGESPEVWAFLDRTNIYTCEEDSFSNSEVTGIYQRSFYIRPQGGAEVDNARILMESGYPENTLKPSIHWEPDAIYNPTSDDPCTIEWTFIPSIPTGGHAYVGLALYGMPATFTPGFDYERTVYPILITKQTAIQTVTIEFTPYIDFYNAHLYVVFGETPEASVSVVTGSETPDWFWDIGDPNSVNWQGDPELGDTYIFNVELEVTNKLYPNPIFYKPHVGSGAFFNLHTESSSLGSITITDTVLDGEVTYSGTVTPGETDWVAKTQDENTVRFPMYSAPAPTNQRGRFWAEGRVEWMLTEDPEEPWKWRGVMMSNIYGFGHVENPYKGKIMDWEVDPISYEDKTKHFTGTFTIAVPGPAGYITGGFMYVSFDTKLERIPMFEDELDSHINFWGKFEIVGGTGQYSCLAGDGEISGTIYFPHDAPEPFYELVLMGEWELEN